MICAFWTPGAQRGLRSERKRVDFPQGNILIREGRVFGQTGIPKSAGSLRDIDMLAPVREGLTAQKANSWLLGGHVFLDGSSSR